MDTSEIYVKMSDLYASDIVWEKHKKRWNGKKWIKKNLNKGGKNEIHRV